MPISEEAKANPMVKPEIPKVMMGRGGYLTNEERIKKDEAELEEMKKKARAAAGIPEPNESETTEDKPSSEEPEAEPVQAESDTKQEEKPEAKAQEKDDLSAEEKTFKQRYGELRRHQQEQKKQFDSKIESLQAQLDKAAKNELVLPKTDEELDAWTKEYPDVAAIIETIADKKARSATQELDSKMAAFEELRYTAKREKAEAELIGMHPDFIQIREDDKFHNWAKDQPKWVQDALYENQDDARSVSRVLDLYKTDMGITAKKSNDSDKAAASSVKTKSAVKAEPDESAGYFRESEVEAMSIKEYEKRQEEILNAQRNGKFIYDISRK